MFLNCFLLSLLAIPSTLASSAAPPITISKDILHKGNGCPTPGSAYFTISPIINTTTDSYTLTLYMERDINPTYGAGTTPADRRKSCEISTDMKVDEGYKLRINTPSHEIRTYGFARLGSMAELHARLSYAFTDSNNSTAAFKVRGPMNGRYWANATSVDAGSESKCGGGTMKAVVLATAFTNDAKDTGSWLGDPDPQEMFWAVRNGVELVKC